MKLILKRNPDINCQLLPDGNAVLFSSKSNWAHIINPVGAMVWEFCDGELSENEIMTQISELVQTDANSLKQEVVAFTKQLLESGLLLGL
jgi:hypothetical protein